MLLNKEEMKLVKKLAKQQQEPKEEYKDNRKLYKVWVKNGNEKMVINYYSELEHKGQVFYHLKKYPRITVGNGIYNVSAYDSFWIE